MAGQFIILFFKFVLLRRSVTDDIILYPFENILEQNLNLLFLILSCYLCKINIFIRKKQITDFHLFILIDGINHKTL